MRHKMYKAFLILLTLALISSTFMIPNRGLAITNSNITPWYPFGMGGGGYMSAISLYKVPGTDTYHAVTGCDSSSAYLSFDEGESWVPVGGAELGGVPGGAKSNFSTAVFDPNDSNARTIFMGTTDSRIMKGATGQGKYSFTQKFIETDASNKYGISTITFAPSNSQIIYAGAGRQRAFLNGGYGPTGAYVKAKPYIYKSTDGGESWTHVGTLLGAGQYATVFKIIVHPTNPSIVYATCDKGLFKSVNGGANWDQLGEEGINPLDHNAVFGLAIDPNNTDLMYVTLFCYDNIEDFCINPDLYTGQNKGGVYKSTDGGENWTEMNLGFTPPAGIWSQAGHFYDVQLSPSDPDRVYVAYQVAENNTNSAVYRTVNGGVSWTKLNSCDLSYNEKFLPQLLQIYDESETNDHVFVVGKVAGHYKSTDSGNSFKSFSSTEEVVDGITYYRGWGLEAPRGCMISVDKNNPEIVYYTDKDRGMWKSNDGGLSYALVYDPSLVYQGDGRGCIPDPDNPQIVYGYIARKDARNADRGYAHFIKSTDGGINWTDNDLSGVEESFIWDMVLDPTTLAPENVNTQRDIYLAAGDGAFYPIQIDLDTENDTYDLYVNYKLMCDNYPFIVGASNVSKLEFGIENGQAGTFNFDSVAVLDSDNQNVANDTFEGDTVGNSPTGWNIYNSGQGSVTVSDVTCPTGKSVKVSCPGTSDTARASRTFDALDEVITVKYGVMPWESTGAKTACDIYSGSNEKICSVSFDSGNIKVYNNATWETVQAFDIPETHMGVYKSTDGGGTWTDIDAGIEAGASIQRLKMDPNDIDTFYCIDANYFGGVYKKDGSANWVKVLDKNVEGLALLDTGTSTVVFAGCNGGTADTTGIFMATDPDGDEDWVRVYGEGKDPATYLYTDIEITGANEIVAGTTFGLVRSTDGGSNWSAFDDGLTYGSVYDVSFSNSGNETGYYAGTSCMGFSKRTTLPFTVVEYKRTGYDYFLYYTQKAVNGMRAYPDAAWQIKEIPGQMGILNNLYNFTTCNTDKDKAGSSLTTLKVNCLSDVYVAVPTGATPSWLSSNGFVKDPSTFDMHLGNTSTTQTMDLYKKAEVAANTLLTLGGLKYNNSVGDVQYLVFLNKIQKAMYDDFEDGDDDGWTDISGSWSVVDEGGNKAYRSDHNSGTDLSYAGDTAWMDYSVEMKVKAASWTGSIGVVARYTDSNNYYRLVYKPGTDELLIIRKKSGVAATLASVAAADLSTGVYHTFKLTLDGEKLTGYIDGEQKISYTDSSANKLVAGCIGAMAYNQYAYCDDVTVIR